MLDTLEKKKKLYEFNLQVNPKVDALIMKFMAYMGLTSFAFQRFYTDGTHFSLFSRSDWCNFYLDKCDKDGDAFWENLLKQPIRPYIPCMWPDAPEEEIVRVLRQFDINAGISFYNVGKTYLDAWEFGTDLNADDARGSFFSRLIQFERFIDYVKPHIMDIIKAEKKELSTKLQTPCIHKYFSHFKAPAHAKTSIIGNNGIVNFTAREVACAQLLMQGLSSKEIGRIIDISFRTVQDHIAQIQKKIGTTKATQLSAILSGQI